MWQFSSGPSFCLSAGNRQLNAAAANAMMNPCKSQIQYQGVCLSPGNYEPFLLSWLDFFTQSEAHLSSSDVIMQPCISLLHIFHFDSSECNVLTLIWQNNEPPARGLSPPPFLIKHLNCLSTKLNFFLFLFLPLVSSLAASLQTLWTS